MATTAQQQYFIDTYADAAKAEQARSGLPASITLAQAILESGWGLSGLVQQALNFFGIKSGKSWDGQTYYASTGEYDSKGNYYTTMAGFRKYDSAADSFADHTSLLQNKRYDAIWQTSDPHKIADELQKAGYATDPSYASKLKGIIDSFNLTQYDDPSAAASNSNNAAGGDGKKRTVWGTITSGDFWNQFWDMQKEGWTNPKGNDSEIAKGFEDMVTDGAGWTKTIGITLVILVIILFMAGTVFMLVK